MAAKKERTLKFLDPDIGVHGALEWLGEAFNVPRGYQVTMVERNGRQKTDSVIAHVNGCNGDGPWRVRFEQRDVVNPVTLRTTLTSETDGKIRMAHLTIPEACDVYAALCLAAGKASSQDIRDETRDWLEQVVRTADPLRGWTLSKEHRYDTLRALQLRGVFDARRAKAFVAGSDVPMHVLLIDHVTHWGYLRSGEVATYIRHVISPAPMSQSTLDGRMAEIGVTRIRYEERRGRAHPHGVFYVLPELGDVGDFDGEKGVAEGTSA